MERDDFKKSTRDFLRESAGNNCVNPACGKPTNAKSAVEEKIVSNGIGAHVSAASPGGPRYNPALTREQRSAADNGAWLCANCATMVDVDPQRFPIECIRGWQEKAAALRQHGYSGERNPLSYDAAAVVNRVNHFLQLCRGIHVDWVTGSVLSKSFSAMSMFVMQCRGIGPSNHYWCQLPNLVEKQVQMIEDIESIRSELLSPRGDGQRPPCWYMERDSYFPCNGHPNLMSAERLQEVNSAVQVVLSRFKNFIRLRDELTRFANAPIQYPHG